MLTRGLFRLSRLFIQHRSKLVPPKRLLFWESSQSKAAVVVVASTSFALFSFAKVSAKSKASAMSDETSLESILQNADQLFDENHFQEACEVLNKFQDCGLAEIKWRKARALYSQSKTIKNGEEKARVIRESYQLISEALDANANDYAIHKWMAIILDANAELDGIKSRVSKLEVVKKHMQRAVELNPMDPTSWYLLGQFEYSLADMPWIQRKIVSAIFATPPTGTYDGALEYFEKAEGIKEGFYSMNWLMLGKCYLVLKDTENAKKFLEKAANCRTLNEDDKICKEEATKLLKKLP